MLAVLATLAACGKRGDPLPPLPVAPQPVTSLKLAQRGAELEIAYVAPRATTGGARLGVLEVEILRSDTPGDFHKTSRPSRRKVAPGETLADTMRLPPVGTTIRVAARALDRGRVSTLSSITTLVVQSPPPPPHDLVGELKGEAVALQWEGTVPSPPPSPSPSPSPMPSGSPGPAPSGSPGPSPTAAGALAGLLGRAAPKGSPKPGLSPIPRAPGAGLLGPSPAATPKPPARGFLVYRRADPAGHYGAPIRPEPFPTNSFEDRAVSLGQRWCYVVATAVSTEPVVESTRSNEVCVSVRDIVPPAAPSGVATLSKPEAVEISWSPSTDSDLASYRVYREAPGAPRERVGEIAAPETSLRDTTAAPGTTYAYTVTAVDRAGNESTPSGAAPGVRR